MSIPKYFINSPTNVYQTGTNAPIPYYFSSSYLLYDYVLDINVSAGGFFMGDLFNNKTFTVDQNNNLNIDLTANIDALSLLLYNTNAVDISSYMLNVNSNTTYNLLERNVDKLFGLRLLEIIATKMFNNPNNLSPITNNNDYILPYNAPYSLTKIISDGINNSLVNFKSNIYNLYVNYNGDLSNSTFNFENTNWEFPLSFAASVDLNNSNSLVNLNGPDVGGNQFIDGSLSIPILLRFHSVPKVIQGTTTPRLDTLILTKPIFDPNYARKEIFSGGFGKLIVDPRPAVSLFTMPGKEIIIDGIVVSGPSKIYNSATICSSLVVGNYAVLNNDVSINSNLNVGGAVFMYSSVNIGGNARTERFTNMYGGVNISGPSTYRSTMVLTDTTIQSDASINSVLNISGNAAFGSLNLLGNLSSNNITTLSNLNISGTTTIGSNLIIYNDLQANNNLTIVSGLNVSNTATISNNFNILNNMNVLNSATINTSLNISTSITTNLLNISSNSLLNNISINSNLFSSGITKLNGKVQLPILSNTQITQLSGVKGYMVYNDTTGRLNLFDGSLWTEPILKSAVIDKLSLGYLSGQTTKQTGSTSIGYNAGNTNQGLYSIAIGNNAAPLNQPNNSIVLNASGTSFNITTANAFYVNSVNSSANPYVLFYDPTTKEITYDIFVSTSSLGRLIVSTVSNLQGSVNINNNLHVSGISNIRGMNALSDMIVTNGMATNGISVSGNTIFTSGNTTINSSLATHKLLVSGNVTTQSLVVGGSVYFGNDNISFPSSFINSGLVTMNSSLNISGNAVFSTGLSTNSNINISVNSTFVSNLNVSGNCIISGDVSSTTNLFVSGISYFKSPLYVSGNSNIRSLTLTSNLFISSNTNINSDVNILGNTFFQNNLSVNSRLNLTGRTYFQNRIKLPYMSQLTISSSSNIQNGSLTYNTTYSKINFYNNTKWSTLTPSLINTGPLSGMTHIGYDSNTNILNISATRTTIIGFEAESLFQGGVSIGYRAGKTTSGSIILNATNVELNGNGTSTNGVFINPIRYASSTNVLYYNTTTNEITSGLPTLANSTLVTTLNVNNKTILLGNTSILSSLNISGSGTLNNISCLSGIMTDTINTNNLFVSNTTIFNNNVSINSNLIANNLTMYSPNLILNNVRLDNTVSFRSNLVLLEDVSSPSIITVNAITNTSTIGGTIYNVSGNYGLNNYNICKDLLVSSTTTLGGSNYNFNKLIISGQTNLNLGYFSGLTVLNNCNLNNAANSLQCHSQNTMFINALNVSGFFNIYQTSFNSNLNISGQTTFNERIKLPLINQSTMSTITPQKGYLYIDSDSNNLVLYDNEYYKSISVPIENSLTSRTKFGYLAGTTNQGAASVAIGYMAGNTNQGAYSIAIGNQAATTNQPNNSIVLNATNSALNVSNTNAFYVNPIRSGTTNSLLFYNTNTKELTYSSQGIVSSLNINSNTLYVSNSTVFNGPVTVLSSLNVSNTTNINSSLKVNKYLEFKDGTRQTTAFPKLPITNSNIPNYVERNYIVNNNWTSITWSPSLSLFCAVASSGTNNRIVISTDGNLWKVANNTINNNWTSITWSPTLSKFCAVASSGTSNRVIISSDGITWTSVSYPVDNDWSCITWSSTLGLFCVVATSGTGNRIMTSSDGNTWSTQVNPVDNNWTSVIWSPELSLFCAVASSGSSNRIITSSNGITWTTQTSPVDNNWVSVTWSSSLGLFCAIASSGTNRIMTSTNGTTWTTISTTTLNYYWKAITWCPEISLFIGISSTYFITSSNGSTWTKTSNNYSDNYQAIVWSPSLLKFCMVGNTKYTLSSLPKNRIFSTPNLVLANNNKPNVASDIKLLNNKGIKFSTWTQKTPFVTTPYSNDLSSVLNIWRQQATNYSDPTGNTAAYLIDICWAPELKMYCAYAAGISGSNLIRLSTDGITWISQTSTITLGTNIIWVSKLKKFYTVNGTTLSESDGKNWVTRSVTNIGSLICWSPELQLLCIIGAYGTSYSSDGITWITNNYSSQTWNSICWSSELCMFCAVTSSGTNRIVISKDGINWTYINNTTFNGVSVCWSPELGLFCAVGGTTTDSSNVIISSDGINWTTYAVSLGSNYFRQVIWCKLLNVFIATKNTNTGIDLVYSTNGINWTTVSNTDIISTSTNVEIYYNEELKQILYSCVSTTGKLAFNSLFFTLPKQLKAEKSILVNYTTPAIGESWQLYVNGPTQKLTTTTWTTGSDYRIKKNIVDADINRCYDITKSIKLKYFEWNDKYVNRDDKHNLGFIAQDVKEVFPNSVTITSEEFDVKEINESIETIVKERIPDFHHLNLDQLYKVMWGTNQKLIQEIEALESEYNQLKIELESLVQN